MSDYVKAQSRDVHVLELSDEKQLRHFPRLVGYAENKWKQILDKGVFKVRIFARWY